MKVQKFVVTIEYSEKDRSGKIIPPMTELKVSCALLAYIDASSITVEEIKE